MKIVFGLVLMGLLFVNVYSQNMTAKRIGGVEGQCEISCYGICDFDVG
jgi:hypothetical protein